MKRAKVSFLAGVEHRARETWGLGRVLVTEPRAFPGTLGKLAKRSVRTVWNARGGRLYACGFVVTLIALEIGSFFDEIVSSSGVADFFSAQLFQMFFRFTVESLENTVRAFIWPAYVLEWSPQWGAAALVALYFLFPRFLKHPLERWLFHDDDPPETDQAPLPVGARPAGDRQNEQP